MTTPKWISKPNGLSGRALSIWLGLAPAARERGELTANNCDLFRGMCRALAVADVAQEAIERDGVANKSTSGAWRANPAVKIMFDAQREAERLAKELGLDGAKRLAKAFGLDG